MIKKTFILIVTIIAVLFLISCSIGAAGPLGQRLTGLFKGDYEIADEQFAEAIEAIKNKDAEALKKVFSQKVMLELTESEIEDQIDYLFRFIEGTIEQWKGTGGHSEGRVSDGVRRMTVNRSYTVTTDIETYEFYITAHTQDTNTPNNMGIYALGAYKSEENDMYRYGHSSSVGIFNPETYVWGNSDGITRFVFSNILVTLKNTDDIDRFKKLFSEKARAEASDFDAGIAYAKDFCESMNPESLTDYPDYPGTHTLEVSYSMENGVEVKETKSLFKLTGKNGNVYYFFIIYHIIHTDPPENQGVYMLQVLTEEEYEKYFDWGVETRCAGIWMPDE